jgi:hypothetical protein
MRKNARYVVSALKTATKGCMYKKKAINCLPRPKTTNATARYAKKQPVTVFVTVHRVLYTGHLENG